MDSPRDWRINLLGGFDVTIDGVPIPRLRSRKGRVLLALLIVRAGKSVERSWLAAVLWPDSSDTQALASLRQTLADLRRAMGPAAVAIESPSSRTLLFRPGVMTVDVLDFDALLDCGDVESLEKAVGLYKGPFLDGSADEAVWNDRERRDLAFTKALDTVSASRASAGNVAGAIECYRRLIAEDPYREHAVQALMKLHAQTGDYSEAYVAYRDLRSRLMQDLRSHPAPETVAVYEQIRRSAKHRMAAADPTLGPVEVPLMPLTATPPALEARASALETLPFPLTSLVGRSDDVLAIKGRLAAVRLVTLTGFGAIGKTRLALAVGHDLAGRCRDGVRFVDLSGVPCTDASVADAIASAAETGGNASDLSDRTEMRAPLAQFLLLIDFGEETPDAGATAIADVLGTYPKARILATSRKPLGVPGEVVYRVGPLSVPDADPSGVTHSQSAMNLVHSEAVRLFVERAASVAPGFSLNSENAAAIARICRSLDGHPLSIEMAAARASLLSVQQIALWIETNLFALTSGPGMPARHQTLRAVLEGSVRELSERQRLLLARLSVFKDGWTHDAALAVCVDEIVSRDEMLDLLVGLADRSLVGVEWGTSGRGRYRLVPIVRRYCMEHLANTVPIDSCLSRRFAKYYIDLCRASGLRDEAPRSIAKLEPLAPEIDNVISALDLGSDVGVDEIEWLDASLCLIGYWAIKGSIWHAVARLDGLIGRLSDEHLPTIRAQALLMLGRLLWLGRQDEPAIATLLSSQAAFSVLGDDIGKGRVVASLAPILLARGDYEGAQVANDRAIELLGCSSRAQQARALVGAALTKALSGQSDVAATMAVEMLKCARESEDELVVGLAMLTMGQVSEICADPEGARRAYFATLALAEEWGAGPLAVSALEGMARVFVAQNKARRAVLLLSAAQAYRESAGLGPDLASELPFADAAHQLMAEPVYHAEHQAGARMTLAQAMGSAMR